MINRLEHYYELNYNIRKNLAMKYFCKLWIFMGTALAICNAYPQEAKDETSEPDVLLIELDDITTSTQTSQPQLSCLEQRDLETKNKAIAMGAYQEVLGDHNIEAADKYFHPDVIQHNPLEADGVESFKKFAAFFLKNRKKEKVDFHRVSAEGNLVWTHVKMTDGEGKDLAFMDIFRIENGKIVEHWDVIQRVPDLSKSKNPHPLF